MSTDTIPARNIRDRTIKAAWDNVLKAALCGDLCPRDASGRVGPQVADLGDPTNFWDAIYAEALKLSVVGGQISATVDSGISADYALTLPKRLPTTSQRITMDASGNLFFSDDVIGTNIQVSSPGSLNLSTATTTLIPNNSVTITSRGRPIIVKMIPSPAHASNGGVQVIMHATDSGSVRFQRGGTDISKYAFSYYAPLTAQSDARVFCSSEFWFFDDVPAGTYTYTASLTLDTQSGGSSLVALDVALCAYEV